MTFFERREYWDDRYTTDTEPFEWLLPPANFKEAMSTMLISEMSILIIGAGSSTLAEELYISNFHKLTNVDFSPVCIELLNERYERLGFERIKNVVQDICDMNELADGSYDAVVDKATLDCLLCDETRFGLALAQIDRVLNADGVYVMLSIAPPEPLILPLLVGTLGTTWAVEWRQVPTSDIANELFLYTARRVPVSPNSLLRQSDAEHAQRRLSDPSARVGGVEDTGASGGDDEAAPSARQRVHRGDNKRGSSKRLIAQQ